MERSGKMRISEAQLRGWIRVKLQARLLEGKESGVESGKKQVGKKLTWVGSKEKPDPLFHLRDLKSGSKVKGKKSKDGEKKGQHQNRVEVETDLLDDIFHDDVVDDQVWNDDQKQGQLKFKPGKLKEADEDTYMSDARKKLIGYYRRNEGQGQNFVDMSAEKLCLGNNLYMNPKLLGKLIKKLGEMVQDGLDEGNNEKLQYFTVSPYGMKQSQELYQVKRNDNKMMINNVMILSLGIAEKSYNLWERIFVEAPDMWQVFEKFGSVKNVDGWQGFLNWMLVSVLKVVRLKNNDIAKVCEQNGIGCYSISDFLNVINDGAIFDELMEMEENSNADANVKHLMKQLIHNKNWEGKELDEKQKEYLKQALSKYKKQKANEESWFNKIF